MSPESATPPAQVFLTVSTGNDTPPGLYTSFGDGHEWLNPPITINLTLNVVNVSENYSLLVSPTIATPSPVPAGSIATTIVTVTPIANYSGSVTLVLSLHYSGCGGPALLFIRGNLRRVTCRQAPYR